MASFNKVILMGNLTKDPERRQTQGGTSICSFTLAVSRKFTSNGQQQEETCFVDITAFGKTADICGQYLAKGSPVMIEGRLKLDQWQDRNTGENRQKLSVFAESVQLLGGRRDDNSGDNDNRNDSGNYNGGYKQWQPQQSRGVDPNYAPPRQEHYQAKANGYQPEDNLEEDGEEVPF